MQASRATSAGGEGGGGHAVFAGWDDGQDGLVRMQLLGQPGELGPRHCLVCRVGEQQTGEVVQGVRRKHRLGDHGAVAFGDASGGSCLAAAGFSCT